MKKYLLLASSNVKKSKSQMITIIALILIASIFLNIWLVLSIDYSENYSKRSLELNSEQALVTFSASDSEFKEICSSVLKADESVENFEIIKTVSANSSVKYSSGSVNGYFSFFSLSDAKNKQFGKYKFLNETIDFKETTAFLPYLFQTGGGYKIGDKFEIELEQNKFTFIVGGFFESMMSGSMNGGVVAIIIHDNAIEKIRNECSLNSLSVSVKLKNGIDDKKFTSKFVENVSIKRLVPYFATWETINKQARTFISGIAGSMIAMVAFLITFITLIVIAFNISNKVEEDMKNLGVLKGVGYKSKQIILSIMLQFVAASLIACIAGIAISYAVLPLVANLLITQTGVIWEYGFSLISALICFILVGGVVFLISFFSSKKIKKITPMTALREGIETHNFTKNCVPLEKTKLNIHAALGFKSLIKNKKQNLAIAIILAALTFVGVFAGALYSNVAVDPEMFIKTITGESADVALVTSIESSTEVYASLTKTQGVKKAYMYHSNTVYVYDTDIMCYISEDFSDINNKLICYEGRLPKHDNEVVVGGVFAKANKMKIGDTIKLRFNKPEAEFLITGFTQSSNYMGNDCMLTANGFRKIGDLLYQTYFINVEKGTDVDNLITDFQTKFSDKIISITNVKKAEEGSAQVYIDMMSIISIAAIVIILLVVLLVLYLMVKTFVLKKRKEMGILKALGYTTKQLVFQTVLSFMPVVLLGVMLGVALGIFFVNPLFTVLLSSVGVMKSMFNISTIMLLIVGFGITLFASLVTFLVSQRIRKISAHKLLTNN